MMNLADRIENIETYGASLLAAMASLRTLESFHLMAYKKGILDEDEKECAESISWEIRRILVLYKKQVEHLLERTEINQAGLVLELRKMMPEIKIPQKPKNVKKSNIKKKAKAE